MNLLGYLIRLAMDWALEILDNFGMNLDTHLMECIGIMLSPFLLSRGLVFLAIRLLVCLIRKANEHRKQLVYNVPYPELPWHYLY